jgi:hypothetical protein
MHLFMAADDFLFLLCPLFALLFLCIIFLYGPSNAIIFMIPGVDLPHWLWNSYNFRNQVSIESKSWTKACWSSGFSPLQFRIIAQIFCGWRYCMPSAERELVFSLSCSLFTERCLSNWKGLDFWGDPLGDGMSCEVGVTGLGSGTTATEEII